MTNVLSYPNPAEKLPAEEWLNALPEAIIATDVEGVILAWNAAAERLFGWTAEEVRGRPIYDVTVPPPSRADAEAIMNQLRDGSSWSGDFIVQHRDGHRFLAHVANSPVFNEAGYLVGILGRSTDVTRERALQRSRDEASQLSESVGRVAPALMAALTPGDARNRPEFVYLNDEWETYTGLTREQLVDWDRDSLYHPDDLDRRTVRELGRNIENGEEFEQRVRVRNAAGEYRWFLFRHRAVFDDNGQLALAVLVGLDIHEQEEAKRAADDREEGLRRLADAIPALVAISAPDSTGESRPIFVNRRWLEYTGLSLDDLSSPEQADPFVPDNGGHRDEPGSLTPSAGEAVDTEARVRRSDGAYRWHRVVRAPIGDSWGRSGLSITVAIDVHESKLAEEAKAHLAAIVDSSRDAIFSKTLDGTITSWNPGATLLYGYTAEETIGRSVSLIIPPERRHELDEILARLRRGEPVPTFETERCAKDGRMVAVSLTISPMVGPGGRVIGASIIGRDISEQRQLLRDLEQANAVKEEFLGLVSHELRSPLAMIVGLAGALVKQADRYDSETAENHAELLQYATRLESLVSNMLVLSRLEHDPVELEPVLVQHLIGRAVDRHRQNHPHRELHVEITPDLPPAEGHPGWTDQVLENLLSNAEKYSPPFRPIVVTANRRDTSIIVRVADSGPGIPAEDLERIFEPFYRSRRASRRQGAGLGLSVCRRLLELQDGAISVRSSEERGTVFEFALPVCQLP